MIRRRLKKFRKNISAKISRLLKISSHNNDDITTLPVIDKNAKLEMHSAQGRTTQAVSKFRMNTRFIPTFSPETFVGANLVFALFSTTPSTIF